MTLAVAYDASVGDQLAYALQLGLGAVFAVSSVHKVRHPRAFVQTVAGYEIVSVRVARVVAPLVTVAEVLVAAALLTGVLVPVAIPVALLMLAGFGTATVVNLRRGRDVDCGCFGVSSERISARSVVRIALLGAAAVVVAGALAAGEYSGAQADSAAQFIDAAALAAALAAASAWLLSARAVTPVLAGLFRRRTVPNRNGARGK